MHVDFERTVTRVIIRALISIEKGHDMKKRATERPYWMPIDASGRTGRYAYHDGDLIVQYGSREKRVRPSSSDVPATHGHAANEALAGLVLTEFPS